MDVNKVDMFMFTNSKYFPPESLMLIREKLMQMDESRFYTISAFTYRDPTMMLVVSVVAGALGIDRFLLGDIGMGVLKLLTGGLCGILWLIDLFGIMNRTRELNLQVIMGYL